MLACVVALVGHSDALSILYPQTTVFVKPGIVLSKTISGGSKISASSSSATVVSSLSTIYANIPGSGSILTGVVGGAAGVVHVLSSICPAL